MADLDPAPEERDDGNEPDVTKGLPFFGEFLVAAERFSFLLQTLVWLILDGLFLLATFYWFRFINTSLHGGGLDGWQAALFTWCRGALETTPLALVAVHTLLDFLGALKRMVARR